jgi:hypothetical protein
MRAFEAPEGNRMKILCHFENTERKSSQLRSMIEDLKRGVLLLEADIQAVEKFKHQANPTKTAYPIETMNARRENLVRTILVLQGKFNELELVQFSQSASQRSGLRDETEQVQHG